jgi:oxygen-independent coproporphyrinogen-3 oxidase
MTPPKPAGLYVHIPFCLRKCRYCNFYSTADLSRLPDFIQALHAEMALARMPENGFDTLYFGGGTPSVLAPNDIEKLVDRANTGFNLNRASEITIEVNPGTANLRALAGFRTAGANRINIGVQSFQDRRLAFLGRIHTAADACRCIDDARRAGFERIGIDLIYGLPGQSEADWMADLDTALQTGIDHISAYMLSYEPGTPLARSKRCGHVQPLSNAAVAAQYHQTVARLTDGGFTHYEVSNFARGPAQRSIHNCKYWSGEHYTGLGPAAHSYNGNRRWWNVSHIETYIANIRNGCLPIEKFECLDRQQRWIEMLYLGLRQSGGLDFKKAERLLNIDLAARCRPLWQRLANEGYARLDDRRCVLTSNGMLLLDAIVQQVLMCVEDSG